MAEAQVKVVLKQTYLKGTDGGALQLVAVVYIDGEEFRVMAPPAAEGPALDWFSHLFVRAGSPDGYGDVEIGDGVAKILVLRSVLGELTEQRQKMVEAMYRNAQICLAGHVQSCDGTPFDPKAHCPKCGAACIDACPACGARIRGCEKHTAEYSLPQYCHGCGKPYPWMEDRLRTGRALLQMDEKLTEDDRKELFDLLKDVMSDPMSPLAPAKKKILDGKLERVQDWVRELVLDLAAKTGAEIMKG